MGGADLLVGRPAADRARLRRREAELKVRVASLEKQLGQAGEDVDADKAKAPSPDAAKLHASLNQAREALYQFYRDERGTNPVYRNLLSVEAGLPRLGQIQRRLVLDDGLLLVYLFGVKAGYVLAIGPRTAQLVELKTDPSAARESGSRPDRSRPGNCRPRSSTSKRTAWSSSLRTPALPLRRLPSSRPSGACWYPRPSAR